MTDRVYLPDVDVLFAAHVSVHVHHAAALSWLRGVTRFATCGTTEQELVRLLSNPTANPGATTPADALAALNRVRNRRQHFFWQEQTSLADPLVDVSRMTGHKQVTDFHLLNLATHYQGVLVTFDAKIERALAPKDRRHVVTLSGQ